MSSKLRSIIYLMLAAALLVGCGSAPGAGTGEPAVSGPEATGGKEALDVGAVEYETTLAAELLELPVGMAYASAQCRVGDVVWLGGVSQDGAVLGSAALDGGPGSALVPLPEGCEFVYAMCAVGENVAVLAGSFLEYYIDAQMQYIDVEDPDGRLELLVYDGTELVSRTELAERYGLTERHFSGFSAMLELDGSFYALCSGMIVRLSPDGTETARFEAEGLVSMCVFEGEIAAAARDWESFSTTIYRLNMGTLVPEGEAEIPDTLISGIGVAGGALCADNGEGVYVLDGTLQPGEELFTWPELFVSGGVNAIEELDDGYLFYTQYQQQLCCAHWREGPARKTVVMAADISYGSAQTLANAFNLSQSEYFLEVRVYEHDEEGEIKRLQTDIGAGSWPDIFAFSEADTLAEMRPESTLVDLYGLMDGDGGLSVGDFVVPLLNAMEERGALYWLPYRFWVATMIAPASLLPSPGVSVEEVTRVARENSLVPMQQWITREDMLSWCSIAAVQQYVDWENGTCAFDSEGFVHLLELCGGMFSGKDVMDGEIYTGPDNPSLLTRYFLSAPYAMIARREASSFVSPDQMVDIAESDDSFGEGYCFVGFPETMGNGSIFWPQLRFAITAGAKEKDGAWEFLKFASGEKGQNAAPEEGITSNAAMLEAELASLLRDGYTDYNGGRHEFYESDAQKFRELLDGAEMVMGADPVLEGIISDCAAAFFAGDKTAEQTARDVQGRAAIYVAERG